MRPSGYIALLAGLASCAPAWAQDSGVDAAKQFFARYVALEQAYDPALGELCAGEAFIKKRQNLPMGEPRDVTVDVPTYKARLRQLMSVAKGRGDRNTYSKVSYTPEGAFVRIHASRLSDLDKRTSPMSLLVGPAECWQKQRLRSRVKVTYSWQ